MKRVIILHGWYGYPEEGMFPWLKRELESRGVEVLVPAMPDAERPQIDTWVSFLREQIDVADENTVLFGHSVGAQTILRYLQALNEKEKIAGVVFLAGWIHLSDASYETEDDREIAKPWLETPLDWEKIKSHADAFAAIFSDDDPFVPLSDAELFKEKLGANIIIERNQKHFSGSDGIKELPSALEAILKMTGKKP